MPISHPNYPCVDSSLKEARSKQFRGNTLGQVHAFHEVTDADREKARNFDVKEQLKRAEAQREAANL